jgi:tRNA nucleotidyltransferase (CCA-adding enzyme)
MLKLAAKAATSVDTSAILSSDLQGAKIGDAIRRLRIKAVADVINAYKPL